MEDIETTSNETLEDHRSPSVPGPDDPRLSWITGEFLDPQAELAFRKVSWHEDALPIRYYALGGAVLFFLGTWIDSFHFSGDSYLLLLFLRALVLLAAFGIAFLTTKNDYETWFDTAIGLAEGLCSAVFCASFVGTGSGALAFALLTALLLLVYYFVIPSRFVPVVLNASALTLATAFLSATTPNLSGPNMLLAGLCLVAVNVIGLIHLPNHGKIKRTSYILLQREQVSNQALRRAMARQVESQKQVVEEGQELSLIFDATPFPLFLVRAEDSILLLNNFAAAEVLKLNHADGPVNTELLFSNLGQRQVLRERLLSGHPLDREEVQIRTLTGEVKDVLLSVQIVEYKGETCFIAGFADITAQKALESALHTLATTDSLTSVANRRSFMEHAQAELLRAQRYKRLLSILLIDLDQFKEINDRHGHQAGDKVLQAFTQRCLGVLRSQDFLGRIGGEEFALVLPETGTDEAMLVAERLRDAAARRPLAVEGTEIYFTVSIGQTEMAPTSTLDSMIRIADTALYRAKSKGRDQVVQGEPDDA